MQFIFLNANGDVAFCPTEELKKQIHFINLHPDKTFLIQSKNPKTFNRVKFPNNVILGTTIETNLHRLKIPTQLHSITYKHISNAPHPNQRIKDFKDINHPLKMLTYEPILLFQIETMIKYAKIINPCMIWLGYDSKPKQNKLPEPPLSQFKELHWGLSREGFFVILKTVRKAWYEE